MGHLMPGAWFELAEVGSVMYSDDNTMPDDWAPNRAFKLMVEGLTALGRPDPDAAFIHKLLADAGFVDIEVRCSPMLPDLRVFADCPGR